MKGFDNENIKEITLGTIRRGISETSFQKALSDRSYAIEKYIL
jgi:hypothetical protein